MDQLSFELPELDRKKTQTAVEDALEKYRIFKYVSFEEREASITASYSDMPRSNTNVTSDQTADIAIYNTDMQEARKTYCDRIERAVRRLPRMERFLIEERYMSDDAEYITDYNVYCFKFQPPIGKDTYAKIRWKAFYKLALSLNIQVVQE
ncbi:transcriptional regulator [Paenibacillus alvei]|uniref:Transcriptional regulator n=1 Tax=Paenibacillus alvei TaxID=44250 RepID=A0ABT4H7R5_PAEAL|nr:ArpU family phage packaging/lysis transcriptional regulator [Paenibacillus alvei]MCY9765030.1 transcriptional regulator [Paenibacillus alvei]MCY9770472.1 transcriptional regulator [Paenibacillus alvei]